MGKKFEVGKAYYCRMAGDVTAHRVLKRTTDRVQITCDIIRPCSDYCPWHHIRIIDGVETTDRGCMRADDIFKGKGGTSSPYHEKAKDDKMDIVHKMGSCGCAVILAAIVGAIIYAALKAGGL